MENNIEENINDYDFDIMELVKAGWERINGVKGQFFIAFAIYVVVSIAFQLILGIFLPQGVMINQLIVTILSYPVLVPIITGIMMMAINHSRGETVNFKSIFNHYHLTGVLSLASILLYVATVIGFVLLIIPAIYLSVAYAFVLPLIADKNMGAWEAMEYSRKTVTKRWFKVAGLMGLLSIAMGISIIPLGVGLVWTVPLMFVTLYGLAYPILFDGAEA